MEKSISQNSINWFQNTEIRFQNAETRQSRVLFAGTWMGFAQKSLHSKLTKVIASSEFVLCIWINVYLISLCQNEAVCTILIVLLFDGKTAGTKAIFSVQFLVGTILQTFTAVVDIPDVYGHFFITIPFG